MAEKIYGICENKCLKEVIAGDNFVTITGGLQIVKSASSNILQGNTTINFPDGFTKDNCVVISIGLDVDPKNSEADHQYAFGTESSEGSASAYAVGSIGRSVLFRNDGTMQLRIFFDYDVSMTSEVTKLFYYKIVLMKLPDVDISNYEMGDINMDGVVNSDDMTLLQNYLNYNVAFTDKQFKLADMDGNGILDSMDMYLLQQKINGVE